MLASPVAESAAPDGSVSGPSESTSDDVFTMEEAARRKGVSYHTVSRAVRSGKLRATRRGRKALIDGKDLQSWTPMRQRAPKRYRKPQDLAAVPGILDLASDGSSELARRLAVFAQSIHAEAAEHDQQTFHQLLCDRFAQAVGLRRVTLWRVDLTWNILTQLAAYGPVPRQAPTQMSPIPLELRRHLESNSVVNVQPGLDNTIWPADAQLDHARSMVIAPLRRGEQLIGSFIGDWDGEQHEFCEDELGLTQIIANQAALAFDLARSRDKLAAADWQLAFVLEQLPYGIILVDSPDGRLIFANSAACVLIGRQDLGPDRTLAELPLIAEKPEIFGDFDHQIEGTLTAGKAVSAQPIRVVNPDGSETEAIISVNPMRDRDERQIGAVCVLETGPGADRTAKMTTAIVDSITHQLRNTLTSLIGNVQLLQRHLRGQEPVDLDFVAARVDRIEASGIQLGAVLKARE
ncbi:MAG: excisionase family DNA-binding protein [Thermomicrobiales bacterium]